MAASDNSNSDYHNHINNSNEHFSNDSSETTGAGSASDLVSAGVRLWKVGSFQYSGWCSEWVVVKMGGKLVCEGEVGENVRFSKTPELADSLFEQTQASLTATQASLCGRVGSLANGYTAG